MFDPFARSPRLATEQWKLRARAIQDRIRHWSLEELLRGKRLGEAPHLGGGGGHGHGYDPNQPRVPAGDPDGGQWTKVGGTHARTGDPIFEQHHYRAGTRRDDAGLEVADEQLFSQVNYATDSQLLGQPSVEVRRFRGIGTSLPWRRYAETRQLSADDERAVEETTSSLTNLLVRVNGIVARMPGQTPQQYGIAVHTAFGAAVKALKLPPHVGTLEVEQSYNRSGSARYGERDSIRTDVILRNAQGVIIAIYDVKTGDAEMRPSTEQRYREYTRVSPAVQLIILRARRPQG
jgi:hypothetical protein